MSHTFHDVPPTLDEDDQDQEDPTMDETAAPEAPAVRVLTKAEHKAIAAANRRDRAADVKAREVATAWTYFAAVLATVLAVQGMVLFWHEVIGMVLWASVILAGVLEFTLVASALWDRVAAMRGRSTRATATWIVAAASGILAGIHEVARPLPDGTSAWTFEPFTILAAIARVVPPLLAAWLWHKLLVEAGHEAEGRTMSEVRRSKRMHRVARLAHDARRIEKRLAESKNGNLFLEMKLTRTKKRQDRAYDRLLKVISATDPRLGPELDAWARALAVGDTLSSLTDVKPEESATTAAAVMQVPAPPRQQRRRPAAAPAPRKPSSAPPVTASAAAAPAPENPSPVAAGVEQARARTVESDAMNGATDGPSEKERVLALFAAEVAANPDVKPDAARLHDLAGVTASRATSRRWVQAAWEAELASLGDPSAERDGAQLDAEAAREPEGLRVVG
ncbi:hypothetical protein ACFCZ3_20340 [Cellulosimicrobium cellulans]|uniref:hypothetical protein n=1 Tax=Cellulosimicrobium cellulans TaxID=1710 RepID=UPI0035E1B88E